ncbi:MAG: hypothetical protein E6Q83_11165 [Thiothrix sp.]|nr:MAG: hypothetical protein E6Q83_11165 [Thiothrix sp.]
MDYQTRLKSLLKVRSEQAASTLPTKLTALERLRQANATVGIPLVELLQWYQDDLAAIETDPELTDSKLLAYVQDYAKRRRGGQSC